MKVGRFTCIPEAQADVRTLWEKAQPLALGSLPTWLTPEESAGYRHLTTVSRVGLSQAELAILHAEMEQCRKAGLILDPDNYDERAHHIFLAEPKKEAIWSISFYRGNSPFGLMPVEPLPALSRHQVSDVTAMFVADPFLYRDGEIWYLFFEVMNWRTWKGEIGCATSSDGLEWTYRQIVLDEPFHLSYPYVFSWRGQIYMVPESHEAGAVRLYEAVDFPIKWSCVATLLTGPYYADTTLFRHDDRWWLLTDTSQEMKSDTLRLFSAEQLHGPWSEHPRSPIIQGDPKNARPAGRVVQLEDKLIRFAQSCVPYYGTDVRAYEIEHLTIKHYQEREILVNPLLEPSSAGWNSCGMHHIDLHQLEDGSWFASVDGWCWG